MHEPPPLERKQSNGGKDTIEVPAGSPERVAIGDQETKHVCYTRTLVILVLLAVAATVSTLAYRYSSNVQEETFKSYFVDVAEKITSQFVGGAIRRIAAIEEFSTVMTSFALQSSNETSWPFVTLPNFEHRAEKTMFLSDALSLTVLPIVSKEDRLAWEEYSVANQQWFLEGLEGQGIPEEDYNQAWIEGVEVAVGKSVDYKISEEIFRTSPFGQQEENGPGPYTPWWQWAPVYPVSSLVNCNILSHPTRLASLQAALGSTSTVISGSWDYSKEETSFGRMASLNLLLQHGGKQDFYEAGPVADLYVPVFEDFDRTKVVALLTAYVYWQPYFEGILSPRDVGIYVILENTCNETYTYRLDGGDATYIGEGDLHDDDYTRHGTETEYGSFIGVDSESDLPEGQCLYRIRAYPSQDLEDTFTSNDPLRFALMLAGTILLTSLVFLLYDYLVERRQRLVMNTAVKSSTVVASLFPEQVRDRLYETTARDAGGKKDRHLSRGASALQDQDVDLDIQVDDPLAIADLYPNCTVQFCDIVGFTKWSSTREPRDVFRLLETIYKSFDRSASRLGVFKVETIGDCYVAVTGLPRPQADHATVMAMFAVECLLRLAKLTHRLADQLGPDTADLTVRIGMHSGPVTGGVLRGANARFQLFGDTMNTAARLESTGQPSKIQVSSSTAGLLRQSGQGEWLCERQDKVNAKGKGTLETYWLLPSAVEEGSTLDTEESK